MGERRLRDALAIAGVALVAGAGGYALRAIGEQPSAREAAPLAASGAPAADSAQPGPAPAAEEAAEREQLREQLADERALRARLETQLRALREEVSQLAAAYREDSESEVLVASDAADAGSPGSVAGATGAISPDALPQPKGVNMAALEAAGFGSYEAERIRERIESIVLRQLQLENVAKREGWHKTPRYGHAARAIGSEFDDMRTEYGEDRFDWILYSTGRKNRIVVDAVYGESAAGQVGIEPGDLILRYADARVFNGQELRQATLEGELGQLVPLEYERAGQVRRVFVPRGPVGVQLHEATLAPPTR